MYYSPSFLFIFFDDIGLSIDATDIYTFEAEAYFRIVLFHLIPYKCIQASFFPKVFITPQSFTETKTSKKRKKPFEGARGRDYFLLLYFWLLLPTLIILAHFASIVIVKEHALGSVIT